MLHNQIVQSTTYAPLGIRLMRHFINRKDSVFDTSLMFSSIENEQEL